MNKIVSYVKKVSYCDLAISFLFIYWSNYHLYIGRSLSFRLFFWVVTLFIIIYNVHKLRVYHVGLILSVSAIGILSLMLPAGSLYLDNESFFLFMIAGGIGSFLPVMIKNPKNLLVCFFIGIAPYTFMSLLQYSNSVDMGEAGDQYMVPAYLTFYLFSYFFLIFVFKKVRSSLLLSIFCLLIIFFLGTRGAIFSAILLVILIICILLFKGIIKLKSTFKILVGFFISLSLFIIYYLESVILFISDQLGINSRLLYLLESNEGMHSDSRIEIYLKLWGALSKYPFGLGLRGDMYLTNGEYYAHNFFLELVADFGFWAFLIIFLFFLLVKNSLLKIKNTDWLIVGILYFSITVFPRIFSGTFIHTLTLPFISLLFHIAYVAKKERV